MKKLTFLLLSVLLLSSCVTQKKCTAKFPPQTVTITKDSIREKITYRDTTIYIYLQGEERTIYDTIIVKNGLVNYKSVSLETNLATARAWVALNRINLTLSDKDTTIHITLKNALKTSEYWENRYHNEKQTVEVKYIPKIYTFALYFSIFVLIGLALYFYHRFS